MNKEISKFVISIDFELAWGSVFDESIYKNNIKSYKKTRKAIAEIIELFERYEISATWGFVGHLMLDQCIEANNKKHPDIIRPNYKWFDKDWFYLDPCGREEGNSIWYADDVLKKVKTCKVKQEIASHSFSHILFGEDGCSKECAESDIKKCIELAASNDIYLTSFIFPCHSEGHKDILKKYGFRVYRGRGTDKYNKIRNKKLKRLALIIDKILALSPTTGRLTEDEFGLCCTPGNMSYYRYKGWKNKLTYKSAVKQAKKGIDKAIEKGEIFHFWFHPFQIAESIDGAILELAEIFEYASINAEKGYIKNVTMEQLIEEKE